jgi:hypothetical protein
MKVSGVFLFGASKMARFGRLQAGPTSLNEFVLVLFLPKSVTKAS